MRVLLTGGGTAGHINPALAIAETVLQNAPESEIAFVGIKGGKEEDLVPRYGYPLHYVRSQGIQRSLSLSNVKALWLALVSPYEKQTTKILDDFKPDIVIGTGGYACWPIMAAAARRGIPTALHESNALPGLAVRRLQKRVDRIWVNFSRTAELLKARGTVMRVGNPLRSGFAGCSREEARQKLGIRENQTFILSFGGSLGAERVNLAVLDLMKTLSEKRSDLLWKHAAGKRDYEDTKQRFTSMGLDFVRGYELQDYIYDMPIAMAAADLVISRAGAMTLSELAGMGKAAILIPSPNVADNHQYHNAKALADAKAAILVEEREFDEGMLAVAVESLLNNPERRNEMGRAIRAFRGEDANALIWQDIQNLTKK